MVAYLLYNRQTPGEGQMAELGRQLATAQVDCKILDADSPEGIGIAEHYDILGRPAAILVRDDGSPVQSWQGDDQLPNASEISYLAHQ
jgi:hypothetical protein